MHIRSNRLISAALFFSLAPTTNANASVATVTPASTASRLRDYPHPRVVKLVFDLDSVSESPAAVNPGLVAIAELIRQYGTYGSDSPDLSIVVVLHGKTTELALDRASSTRRTGAANGSIPLMTSMADHGVKFLVSRQALSNRAIGENEMQSMVRFGPSAAIIFLDLEASGYVFDGSRDLAND